MVACDILGAVLVIDDEFGVAEVIEAILEDDGHKVVCAVNGLQGLQQIAEEKPHLILLDFMMPIMDGPATLRAIQGDSFMSPLPVVMMSSLDEATIAAECENYIAFLRKPFRAVQVSNIVARALKNAGPV